MKRILILFFCAVSVFGSSSMHDAPDVLGTGTAVNVFPPGSGTAVSYLIIADPGNASPVRCGGPTVTANRGALITPGGGIGWSPISGDTYDLASVFCWISTGDKVSVAYAR